jgi:hypothetical protein
MRVPDGTDWYEYMLNVKNPSARTLGVMNHMALGVPDVQTMPIRLTPKTTIGSVMPYDLAFGLSYDAAGNAADVPIGRRGGSVPAGCPVA